MERGETVEEREQCWHLGQRVVAEITAGEKRVRQSDQEGETERHGEEGETERETETNINKKVRS